VDLASPLVALKWRPGSEPRIEQAKYRRQSAMGRPGKTEEGLGRTAPTDTHRKDCRIDEGAMGRSRKTRAAVRNSKSYKCRPSQVGEDQCGRQGPMGGSKMARENHSGTAKKEDGAESVKARCTGASRSRAAAIFGAAGAFSWMRRRAGRRAADGRCSTRRARQQLLSASARCRPARNSTTAP